MKKHNVVTSTIESLDAAVLEQDHTYQRPVEMNRVREIVKNFDRELVNIPKVSFRDGHYYIFDGSHTVEALRIYNGKEHFMVVCKLYKGLSYERESELFALQNGIASRVSLPYKLRALEAAKDGDASRFFNITRSCGFAIAPGERRNGKNKIAAVCKAYSLYKELGPTLYRNMLLLIKDTWGGAEWSLYGQMLSGVSVFYTAFGHMFERKRFIEMLSPCTLADIRRIASSCRGGSFANRTAVAIGILYNGEDGSGGLDVECLIDDIGNEV